MTSCTTPTVHQPGQEPGTIIWVFVGVGQRHEDHPPPGGPEDASVDACQAPQEVPAARPGEAPYLLSDASTTTRGRTPVVNSWSPRRRALIGTLPRRRRRGLHPDVTSRGNARLSGLLCLRPDMRGRKPSRVGRRCARALGVSPSRDAGRACRRGAHRRSPPTKSAGSTPSAMASLRTVRGYAPLLDDSSRWTVV